MLCVWKFKRLRTPAQLLCCISTVLLIVLHSHCSIFLFGLLYLFSNIFIPSQWASYSEESITKELWCLWILLTNQQTFVEFFCCTLTVYWSCWDLRKDNRDPETEFWRRACPMLQGVITLRVGSSSATWRFLLQLRIW